MLRVGVIGCGYWGPNLVRVFMECDGSTVTAICDTVSDRWKRICARYPTIEGHGDARELIARDDVDLVAVATPVDSHYVLAREAIDRGKHVLVEKPFTDDSEDAEELIDRARRKGVLLAVDHTFLFTPAVEKIKALIQAGEIGRVNYVDSVRINLGLIQEEINVVWDLAPHDLSIVDYVIGRSPERVVATGSCHTIGGQADVAYINLDFGDGLIANFHVNWLSPVKVRRMIFGGDRKMIIFDDLSNSEKIRVYDSGAEPIANTSGANGKRLRRVDYRIGDIWTPHIPLREALSAEAQHLVSAVESSTPLRVDGEAGLRVVRVLEACDRSLREDGARVVLAHPAAAGAEPVLAGAS
ncbi:MAG: Gfo/Idh/MocA family oxidoreductase [Phycisphaerales bacterium]|nr:MAG: Gfo/Idh/MocA family oxidoreductase [Phycisphaerales bacterium]